MVKNYTYSENHMSVKELYELYKKNKLIVRESAIKNREVSSNIIELILLGLPLPSIIAYKSEEDIVIIHRNNIISDIFAFIGNVTQLTSMRMLSDLNSLRWNTLDESYRNIIFNQNIHIKFIDNLKNVDTTHIKSVEIDENGDYIEIVDEEALDKANEVQTITQMYRNIMI